MFGLGKFRDATDSIVKNKVVHIGLGSSVTATAGLTVGLFAAGPLGAGLVAFGYVLGSLTSAAGTAYLLRDYVLMPADSLEDLEVPEVR